MTAHGCSLVEAAAGEGWYVVCDDCGLLDTDRLTRGDAQALALDHERYQGRYGS